MEGKRWIGKVVEDDEYAFGSWMVGYNQYPGSCRATTGTTGLRKDERGSKQLGDIRCVSVRIIECCLEKKSLESRRVVEGWGEGG
jgi:hypothetical protein